MWVSLSWGAGASQGRESAAPQAACRWRPCRRNAEPREAVHTSASQGLRSTGPAKGWSRRGELRGPGPQAPPRGHRLAGSRTCHPPGTRHTTRDTAQDRKQDDTGTAGGRGPAWTLGGHSCVARPRMPTTRGSPTCRGRPPGTRHWPHAVRLSLSPRASGVHAAAVTSLPPTQRTLQWTASLRPFVPWPAPASWRCERLSREHAAGSSSPARPARWPRELSLRRGAAPEQRGQAGGTVGLQAAPAGGRLSPRPSHAPQWTETLAPVCPPGSPRPGWRGPQSRGRTEPRALLAGV